MNVTFKTIKINNFLSLGQDISIDLDGQGFVLVKGSNKESSKTLSNGAGKSAIFDAIFWTICGETLRGASDIVNENSSGGCSCELILYVDDTEYQVIRYKSHSSKGNSLEVYENGNLLSDQTKKSQEMISKIIPTLSPEVLGSIALLGQGLPYKFSSMTPSRRKDILDTMSGSSSQVEKLKYQIEVEESSYNREMADFQEKITKNNYSISSAQREIELYKELSKESPEEVRHNIDVCHQEISDLEDRKRQINEKVLKLQGVSSQISNACQNLRDYLSGIRTEISKYQSELSQVSQGVCPTCGRPYEDFKERELKVREYTDKLSELQKSQETLNAKYQGLVSQDNEYKKKISEISNQGSTCDYNIRSLDDKIKSLEKQLSESEKSSTRVKELENSLKEYSVKSYDLNKSLEGIQEYIDSVSYLKRQLSRDFKGFVLEESIKFLSSKSETYGNYFFKDKKVSVELSGNKILISLDGRMYENLSGGERQRVDLSVQFALRDLLVITSGFSCNILVLDEAFDSLDSQGSDDLINLISSEFNDINSVFTVTHHSDISIPYDKTILVTKNSNGISEVRSY